MKGTPATSKLSFQAMDASGQKCLKLRSVPADATVGEVLEGLLGQMSLPRNSPAGEPVCYQVRSDRLGRHLHPSELVADTIQENDKVSVLPDVSAGIPTC
jgi:hypothetical protein